MCESTYEEQLKATLCELIQKTKFVSYRNDIGVCWFCGGGRTRDPINPVNWTPNHRPNCIYARAQKLIDYKLNGGDNHKDST